MNNKIKYQPLDLSIVTKRVISNKIELITEFLEIVNIQLMSQQDKLDNTIMNIDFSNFTDDEDFNQYADFLTDQNDTLDNVKLLSSQLAIVALYRIVEIGTSKQLLHLYKEKEIKNMSTWTQRKSNLLNDYKIDIRHMQHYGDINELRLLNNAIKHKNKVTPQLAKLPGWVEGNELNNLDSKYADFSVKVPKYMSSLVKKFISVKSKK